jgi:ATP-dependent Clp protease ATP-binding subunit ClpA
MTIAQQLLADELVFLAERGVVLSCSSAVLPFLVQRGFHPRLGARPMRDVIEKHVRDAVGAAILSQGCIEGRALIVFGDQLRIL